MVKVVQFEQDTFVADSETLVVNYQAPPADQPRQAFDDQSWTISGLTVGADIRVEIKTEAIESLPENRWWLVTVDTGQFLYDSTSWTGQRMVDVELPYTIVNFPTEIDEQITAEAVDAGQEVWAAARGYWLDRVNFWVEQDRTRQLAAFTKQEADRYLAYQQTLADQNLLLQTTVAQTNLLIEQRIADHRAEYDRLVSLLDAQYQQSVSFAEAYNDEVVENNQLAELYNAVLDGQPLTPDQQSELLTLVGERPELFTPETGFLSSSQIQQAITDPTLLESTVTQADGLALFSMPTQPDGSLTTNQISFTDLSGTGLDSFTQLLTTLDPTKGVTPTGPAPSSFFSSLSQQEALAQYSFVCTCADFTGRNYNSSTGQASSWTTADKPALYGQQVCKHILSVWNQLGWVTAADIPPEPI